MPTFPCKLLVHGKPCNYGDQCNFSHDDALVKRFQQAECPHGKGCAFKDVGSGCIYGRHNLPAPTSQDTVREDEEIAHAQDAVRGDDGHADNAWFLDTCCTAGVFKTPQLAPSHPPDSRVFFATSNDMTSGPTWNDVQTPLGQKEATLLENAASNVLPGYSFPEGGIGITWFEANCPRPPGMEAVPDGCYLHGRTEDGEITSVQLDTSSKKPELPEKLPFESCQTTTKTDHAVIVETVEPRIEEVSETTMSKVAPFAERSCFGCGGKDHLYAGCIITGRFVESARRDSGVIPFEELPGKSKQDLLKATHKRYNAVQPVAVWTSCDAAPEAPLFDDVRVLDVTLDDRGAASWVKEAVSNVAPDPGRKARLYLDEVADMMLEEGYEDSVMDKEYESKAVRFEESMEAQGLFLNRKGVVYDHEHCVDILKRLEQFKSSVLEEPVKITPLGKPPERGPPRESATRFVDDITMGTTKERTKKNWDEIEEQGVELETGGGKRSIEDGQRHVGIVVKRYVIERDESGSPTLYLLTLSQ